MPNAPGVRKAEAACKVRRIPARSNQVVDLEGVAEDCRCMCVLEPGGLCPLRRANQEASGQLTASVMMHLHAWRPCQLQYVADAFSTQFETAVTPQELAAEDLACMLNETASSTASGPLPDADAQLRACFVSYGPAQVTPYRDGWAFTVRAVATAFAENSLAELESYEKTLELVFPLAVEAPPGAQFSPECWLSTREHPVQLHWRHIGSDGHRPCRRSHPLPEHTFGHRQH